MRAHALTGLLAFSLLVGSSTVAWSDDKEGHIADLVKDAKVTAEQVDNVVDFEWGVKRATKLTPTHAPKTTPVIAATAATAS